MIIYNISNEQYFSLKCFIQVTCLILLAHAPACLIITKEVLLLAGKALLLELSYFCSSQLLSLQLCKFCNNAHRRKKYSHILFQIHHASTKNWPL